MKHSKACDVKWVDGRPVWKRAIKAGRTARMCFDCANRIALITTDFGGKR